MTALAGIGLYSPKQAERLIGVDAAKIRRWLLKADSPRGPLWHPEPQAFGAVDTLSFKDLLEVRAVAQFRQHGVSMQTIRVALSNFSDMLSTDYPLIHPKLVTDGRAVMLERLKHDGEVALTDLTRFQDVMAEVIAPSIKDHINFDANENPVQWTPDPTEPHVVVNPKFAFGKPIILPSHMSTLAIFNAYQAEGDDAETVARNLDITFDEVSRAVNFEKRVAAGAFLH